MSTVKSVTYYTLQNVNSMYKRWENSVFESGKILKRMEKKILESKRKQKYGEQTTTIVKSTGLNIFGDHLIDWQLRNLRETLRIFQCLSWNISCKSWKCNLFCFRFRVVCDLFWKSVQTLPRAPVDSFDYRWKSLVRYLSAHLFSK